MVELKKGALIRVTDEALAVDGQYHNGALWVVRENYPHARDICAFRTKSLTTGQHWTWFDHEFEVTDEEQADG